MTKTTFNPGQCVRVKDGVVAPDQPEICIGGWQGRIRGRPASGGKSGGDLVMIYWDAPTIQALPESYMDHACIEGLQPHCMTLYAKEVEPAEPRDSEVDSLVAYGEIGVTDTWAQAGAPGRRIMEVIAEAFFHAVDDTDEALFVSWERHLRERMRFPCEAIVTEHTPPDWFMQCDDILSLTGIDSIVEEHGVLANVTPEGSEDDGYTFPLAYLELLESADDQTDEALHDYRTWCRYREDPESILSMDEILESLADTRQIPYHATRQAIWRKGEVLPEILRMLEDVRDNATKAAAPLDAARKRLITYAFLFPAYWESAQAYAIICQILKLPPVTLDAIIEQEVVCKLGRILASVCGGETAPSDQLVRDSDVWMPARCGALCAWFALCLDGAKSKEETESFFRYLFQGGLEREPSTIWGDLVRFSAHLQFQELRPMVNAVFAEALVPTDYVDAPEIEELFELDTDMAAVQALDQVEDYPLIGDPISEMLDDDEEYDDDIWDHEEEWDDPDDIIDIGSFPGPLGPRQPPPEPIRREQPKIGRNAPCPCGSGRKYKKCCGR